MIPVGILEDSPRFWKLTPENSDKERIISLDLLEEVRDQAHINSEAQKRRIEVKYKTKVYHRQFKVFDPVLWKAHPY